MLNQVINNQNNQRFTSLSLATKVTHDECFTSDLKNKDDHSNTNTKDIVYKSGATYDGETMNSVKCGNGNFIWPNGDKYTGEFKLNFRHGQGTQIWHDQSYYKGEFQKDQKHGHGIHVWPNNEEYEGTWVYDFRHGIGTYKWGDSCKYHGMFFKNSREGYGMLNYSSGNIFKGLYKKDNRFGPGILEYIENNEDVGWWCGDKLIRLLITIDIDFNMPELDPIDRTIYLPSWYDRESLIYEILNPENWFINKSYVKEKQFIKNDPHIDEVLEDRIKLVDEYLNICNNFNIDLNLYKKGKISQVENISRHFIEMYKHQEKYKDFLSIAKDKFNIDLENFFNGKRESFKEPGLIENASIEIMHACISGNFEKVKQVKNIVNLDVCDNRGLTPLAISVIKCNPTIINFLLDNGADVNQLLDNGLSVLMICVIRYYTSDKFLPNTALQHKDLTVNKKINNEANISENDKGNILKISNPIDEAHTIMGQSTKSSEFDSGHSVLRYKLNINKELVNQYANLLSTNDRISLTTLNEGNMRAKAAHLHMLNEIGEIIELLLKRGANPSICNHPYPALCFAVSAGDVKIVKLLLEKGANCNDKMPKKFASLSPLSLACGVMSESGPELVKLLLDSLADPNDPADIGSEYLSMSDSDWLSEQLPEELTPYVTGRTPLHIACARSDMHAAKVVKLLIDHSANPNVICNGQSPLSLAIASGNREAVDILLKSGLCDPNLPLTNGIGSALCVISSTLYEHNWTPAERIKLIDKLVHYGSSVLQPICFGSRRYVGTVIDYAHHMHNLDVRIAHTPYHSLTHSERDTFNARRELLTHLGKRYREKMIERLSRIPNKENFYDIKNFNVNASYRFKEWGPAVRQSRINASASAASETESPVSNANKKALKWCYTCGRSVGVKLVPCSRCKQVYYCSNACKQKAWSEFHKNECSKTRPIFGINNPLAQTFTQQEHKSILSENIKAKKEKSEGELMPPKQISFFIDETKSLARSALSGKKSEKSAFSQQFATKMAILEKKLARKRFHNDEITNNPTYLAPDNYSFN